MDTQKGIGKYQQYLNMKHEWEGLNCLTLIEYLYKKYLDIDFMDTWLRLGREDGTSNINSKWFIKYGQEDFQNEIKNWIKTELTQAKEFDILVFTNRKDIPRHFGMYIGQNYFIHMSEKMPCSISFLEETYRNKLNMKSTVSGMYRHVKLV